MIAIKTEKEKTEFQRLMGEADDAYRNKKYQEAVSLSIDAWNKASDKNEKATAECRMGWAHRYVGFNINNVIETQYRYSLAKICWRNVLILNPDDVDTVISAIKGLMLLPIETREIAVLEIDGIVLTINKEIAELYQAGEKEIEKRVKGQDAQNLKAELLNSLGIEVRKSDPKIASQIFTCGYLIIELGTREAGNLQHNKATCYLMLKNQDEDKRKKLIYAKMAIIRLEWALREYPEDQKAHRDRVQEKINNTNKEIRKLEKRDKK